MLRCSACSLEISVGSRFCPGCGVALRSPQSPTTRTYEPSPPIVSPQSLPNLAEQRHFVPGTLLAERYRVVARLGHGGMGEVYRADDLVLGQPVALKFLPPHLAADRDRLARFHKEVAAARRVSHPNVCRVYDMNAWTPDDRAAADLFLTMEFIDGEDLSSLLKRVGRVPEEKGIEIARALCSALAAVHDQGLLHRDLKPANVMLDGRGKVKLTDFGLAAVAEDLDTHDVRSGTPLYQAPEQLAGTEVTVRSDLYALGLVLYELFTGRRAYPDAKRDSSPSKPSSHVANLNATVEAAILRCLELDPGNRPRSAAQVLAGLPGPDPLTAALAAGDTPSPRAVANAPLTGTLEPRASLALFVLFAVGLVGVAWLTGETALAHRMPLDRSPREMTRDARAVLRKLDLSVPDGDSAHGYYEDYAAYLRELDHDPQPSWDGLRTGEPPLCYFWYRESPMLLIPTGYSRGITVAPGRVTAVDPALGTPGEVCALFDLKGRLIELHAVPLRQPPSKPARQPDWSALLLAAGLEPTALQSDPAPRRTPHRFADARAAWTGTYPQRPDRPVRVEAATYGGRPVYFYIGPAGVADRDDAVQTEAFSWSARETAVWAAVVAALVLTAVVWLVRRNVLGGRADLRGAGRLAIAVLAIHLILWLVTARHVPLADVEVIGGLAAALGRGVVSGALAGIGYLALEPGVRRRWPWRLVAWSRLLEGQWRDPLVGRDLLIGAVAGVAMLVIALVECLASVAFGQPVLLNAFGSLSFLGGIPWLLIGLLRTSTAFLYFYLLFALTVLTRRQWLGAALWLGVLFYIVIDYVDRPIIEAPFVAAEIGVKLFVLLRFGLLAYLAAVFCRTALYYPLLTFDTEAWHALDGAVPAMVITLLAAYGCYTATSRKVCKEGTIASA